MKRLVSRPWLLAAAVALLLPLAAQAAPPGCSCGGYEYTPQDWAQGNTCTEATNNLNAQAAPYVVCEDGLCARSLVLTAGCHWDTYNGKWQVDGYVQFRCWACLE